MLSNPQSIEVEVQVMLLVAPKCILLANSEGQDDA